MAKPGVTRSLNSLDLDPAKKEELTKLSSEVRQKIQKEYEEVKRITVIIGDGQELVFLLKDANQKKREKVLHFEELDSEVRDAFDVRTLTVAQVDQLNRIATKVEFTDLAPELQKSCLEAIAEGVDQNKLRPTEEYAAVVIREKTDHYLSEVLLNGLLRDCAQLVRKLRPELAEQITAEQLSCLHEELEKVRTSVDGFLKVSP